jgi:hypothetical protein
MRAYLITTGVLFAAIAVAHVFEIIGRHHAYASDVVVLAVSIGLGVWAWSLLRRGVAR